MDKNKTEIITFKVSQSLISALKGVANRSEFIRNALLTALENTCPLCSGTGILSPSQKKHWDEFSENHSVSECRDCHEIYLVCNTPGKRKKRTK